MIPYLDSLVQNEADIEKAQEQAKENQSTFVEAPFKVAEKKKLNLRDAKIVSPVNYRW